MALKKVKHAGLPYSPMLIPVSSVHHLQDTLNNLQISESACKAITSQNQRKSSSKCVCLIQNINMLTAVELLHLAVTTDHKATQ